MNEVNTFKEGAIFPKDVVSSSQQLGQKAGLGFASVHFTFPIDAL